MEQQPLCPLGRTPSTAADREQAPPPAWVYMLRCPDGSLYTGWTNDLAKRLKAHNGGKAGAKYTKMKGQGKASLAYAERCTDKSAALRREAALKKLPKPEKETLAARWAADNRPTLRMATPDDAEAVATLYNRYLRTGVETYQYEEATAGEYRQFIAETLETAPFLVACAADGRLLGYAYAHPWRSRGAFAWDVETTIYCAPEAIGQGVGRRLYTALLELVRRQGYYNALALLDGGNKVSEVFHKKFGFVKFGTEKNTAYKFGSWLNLVYLRLPLQPEAAFAEAPKPVRLKLSEGEVAEVLQQSENFR